MTESGQEPPDSGHGSAGASGGPAKSAGRRRSKNRRRRRGSAKNKAGAGGKPSHNRQIEAGPDPKSGAPSGQASGVSASDSGKRDGSASPTQRDAGGKPWFSDQEGAGRRDRRGNGNAHGKPANGGAAAEPRQDGRPNDQTRSSSTNGSSHSGRHQTPGKAPHRPQNGSRPDKPLYAALDLGTNNCRLLIARPEDRGFRVVDAYSRIVRLGEGVDASRKLSDQAMERAIEALANCNKKLQDRGVKRARLIATEACRAAENGTEFIDRVHRETGLSLEVVDRETEARLAVAGCVSLVDRDAHGVILFDIGGGSSEIVWLDLRNRCGARGYALTRFIRSWISLPIGVVNLAERHGGMHVTPEIFEDMVDDAANHLSAFNLASDLSEAIAGGGVHMLGTSGTVTTLAGVHLGLKRYDRRRVDGTWLDNDKVGMMIDRLRDMPYEERVSNPCIGADRADLVLAGCAILEAIRRRWSCSRLRVADRGLREGILTEMMSADGIWSRKNAAGRKRYNRYRGRG